ncbi:hypothetical protein M9Y10_005664 [Tritrichomonas musculus]|uniref:ABC transporter family protein n=1 Tax=Tritrichomonas musculus TaxID=1915356 RepID=A0ABR2JDT9_9EUKA
MGRRVEDNAYEITGSELIRCYKLMSKKWIFWIGAFFTLCSGAAPMLMNIIMADMMNLMTTQIDDSFTKEVGKLCLKMLYVVLGMTAATVIALGFRFYLNPHFLIDIRQAMYDSLMEQEIAFYDETPAGVLIGRLAEDVTLIRFVYVEKLLMVIQHLTQAVVGLILAFCYVWRVTLAVFIGIPISAIVYIIGNIIIEKLWLQYNKCVTECIDKAEEAITQIRTVKAFDCELKEAALYSKSIGGIEDVARKWSILAGVKDGFISMLTWGMMAGLMYYTYWLMVRKPYLNVESGDIMILMMSMMLGTMGTSLALAAVDDFKKTRISAAKVLNIVEKKPETDRHKGSNTINGKDHVVGKVEFRDVAFRYKTREEYAVKNLSFVINPGETVALVGESGCGKSTTLQLLQRFYEIEKGKILVDDVDIRTLSQIFLRSQIAIVPQGPVLFSMSIKDNIRYAKPKADGQDVANAARTGNAHDFIMELPQNYDTVVQQTSLSGGQKQRICISRAILMNSPILLLDEATAALDTESEQLVQQSLETVRHGKTAIVVAHRLATVMNADRILVFKDGKIHESGTHKELLKQDGLYADLVKFQLE